MEERNTLNGETMEEKRKPMSRSKKLVGLFAAAALAATAVGCSETTSTDCEDDDEDGYCDDDRSGGKVKIKKPSSGKGGVGSSSLGSMS